MGSLRATILDCGAKRTALGDFVRRRGRGLELERFAEIIHPAAPGRDDDWLEQTAHAAASLRERSKQRRPITVMLPPHLVLTKLIKTPRVEAAKRAKVILFEAQQNIPYALADVVWGHAVVGESGTDLEVMLCASKRDAVEALCQRLETAGWALRDVVPGPQALLACYREAQPACALPTALLEIGARGSTLLLADPRQAHLRTIPIGGNALKQQLAESQGCDLAEAEGLKTAGHPAALLAPALDAFAARLALEITRSAVHFKRQSGAPSPERVLLTGGGAADGLADLLRRRLNVPVENFDPLAGVEIARPAVECGAAVRRATFAALVGGAALRTSREGGAIDLLPARLKSADRMRRRQQWLMAAAALAAAVLLFPIVHSRALTAELNAKAVAVEAELAPLRLREAENRRNLEELGRLKTQVAALQRIHNRRTGWQQFLADLQERLSRVEDVWLDRLELAPAPAAGPDGVLRISVSGRMLDKTNPLAKVSPDTCRRVTDLLASLSESPFVAAVEEERFDNSEPGILRFDFVLVGRKKRPL